MIAKLSDLADASNSELFLQAFDSLELMPAYNKNPKVQVYIDKEWMAVKETWASCDRQSYHAGANTNNHVESLNNVVKNKFIAMQQDKRLDSLLKTIIVEMNPFYQQRYEMDNYSSIM